MSAQSLTPQRDRSPCKRHTVCWAIALAFVSGLCGHVARAQNASVYSWEGTRAVPPNSTGLTTPFRVVNNAAGSIKFFLHVACTGSATTCSAPATLQVAGGSFSTVNVSYGTNSLPSGTITLSASDASGSASDVFSITQPLDQRVQVTPHAGSIAVTANASHGFTFTVKNIGADRATYSVTATCTAPVTCSSSSGSVTVNAGDTALYNVAFTSGSSAGGTVKVHAAAGTFSDDGSVIVGIAAPSSLSAAITNSDSLLARDLCFNASLGDRVAYSCGDLQVVHGLPATTTMGTTRAPVLIYNSQQARPAPLVAANLTLAAGAAGPDTILATVTVDSVPGRTWVTKFPGTVWAGGVPRRIAVSVDSLPPLGGNSGARILAYSLDVSACYNGGSCSSSPRQRGNFAVLDRAGSLYGAGWWVAGLERLDVPRMLWIGGDGSVGRYTQDVAQQNIWRAVATSRPDSIVRDATLGTYVRYAAGGARVFFNATSGLQDSTVNILGHRTKFTYASGQLRTIELPVLTGSAMYTFDTVVVSGKLKIVAPPVGGQRRVTTLQIAAGRLTSIADPDDTTGTSSSTGFDYLGAKALLSARRNRAGGRTAIGYAAAQRVAIDSTELTSQPRYAVTRIAAAESRGASGGVLTDSVYTTINGPRRDTTIVRIWTDRFGAPTVILNALGQRTEIIRANAAFPALATELHSPNETTTGFVTQSVYDAKGRMIVQRSLDSYGDGRTDSTRYEWHPSLDVITKIVPPEGDSTMFGYDPANGTLLWQKNARGDSTAYAYTSAGLIQSAKQPLTPPMFFFQDALGNLRKTQSALGFLTLHLRDAIGRDTLIVTPTDSTISVDSTRLIGAGLRTYTRFNLLDRDTLTISVGKHDMEGALTSPDTQALKVRKQFDAEGRLLSVTRSTIPATNITTVTTSWAYDLAGRDTAETAPDGHRERHVRDDAGNVVERWSRRALSDAIRFKYDALNRLLTRSTPAVYYAPDGAAPSYDQGLGLTLPADTASFAYDALGNVASAVNADAKVYRHYFNNGQLRADTLETREWGSTSFLSHVYGVKYTYDRDGRRRTLRHPSTLLRSGVRDSVVYQYSNWGSLASLTDILGSTYSFDYDANGRLAHRGLPGDISDTLRYDADDRLIGRWIRGPHYLGQDPRSDSLPQTTSIVDDTIWRDARGKVVNAETITDSVDATYSGIGSIRHMWQFRYPRGHANQFASPSKESYDHDALGQQISMATPSTDRTYAYEPTTGRLLAIHTPDPSGDFSDFLLDSTLYDAAGNVSEVWRNEGLGDMVVVKSNTHYYYDALDQLRSVDRWADWEPYWNKSSRKASSYEETRYDALGRRVLLRTRQDSATYSGGNLGVNSTISRYVWDGPEVLYEIRYPGDDQESAANLERDTAVVTQSEGKLHGRVAYTTGTGIDEPLAAIRFGYMGGVPIAITLFADYRGNINRGTTLDGHDISTTIPDIPWIDRHVSAYLNNQNPIEPRAWVGDLPAGHETTSGLLYRRNRMLDPVSGRFTQEDPAGLAGGLNLYGYAGGDPVTYSDPFGLMAMDTYVNCRPVGGKGDEGAVAHCAVRVVDEDRKIDQTIELLNEDGTKEIYWSLPGDEKAKKYSSDGWSRVAVPKGMSSREFDDAVLNSALQQTRTQRGQPYLPFGYTNSNRFVSNVITGAGGSVPSRPLAGFFPLIGAPGLCGGFTVLTGPNCH